MSSVIVEESSNQSVVQQERIQEDGSYVLVTHELKSQSQTVAVSQGGQQAVMISSQVTSQVISQEVDAVAEGMERVRVNKEDPNHLRTYAPVTPRATIFPTQNWNINTDVERLHNAIKRIGTDDLTVIEIIGTRTSHELKLIEVQYKTDYGQALLHDLLGKWAISGHFKEVVEYRFLSALEFDVHNLRKAVSGLVTDDDALIEILCTRRTVEIKAIAEKYNQVYKRKLEEDVANATHGDFKKALISELQGNRDETTAINKDQAIKDADKLFNAGEGKMFGTDDVTFNEIFATRNHLQLALIATEYEKISGRELLQVLHKELSGHLKKCIVTILEYSINPYEYYAQRLYSALKDHLTTDDRTLSRIIVSRCEIDLQNIKDVFLAGFQKTLQQAIQEETHHDYKKILLRIVGQ
jgi:annexin A7/11